MWSYQEHAIDEIVALEAKITKLLANLLDEPEAISRLEELEERIDIMQSVEVDHGRTVSV